MKKVRESNIELLRILAMVGVCSGHAWAWGAGEPDFYDMNSDTANSVLTLLHSCIVVCAVNVFVLISGWFGINFSIKGVAKFLFQVLFYTAGVYLVMLLLGLTDHSVTGIIKGVASFVFFHKINWFPLAYLLLMVLSPLLNAFAEKATKKEFLMVLTSFFVFQTWYGFIGISFPHIGNGYSTFSFMGLYLLARYMAIHKPKWTLMPKKRDLAVYAACAILMLGLIITPPVLYSTENQSIINMLGYDGFYVQKVLAYSNPIVIVQAISILLFFTKCHIKPSKFINTVALSSFSALLLTTYPAVRPYFSVFSERLSELMPLWQYAIAVHVYVLLWYAACMVLDRVRIPLWEWCWRKFSRETK